MAATSPGLWKKHTLQNPLWFEVQICNETYWSNPKMCLSSHQPECLSWEESLSKWALPKGIFVGSNVFFLLSLSHPPGAVLLPPTLHSASPGPQVPPPTQQQQSAGEAERSECINFWHVRLKHVANKWCAERKAVRLDPYQSWVCFPWGAAVSLCWAGWYPQQPLTDSDAHTAPDSAKTPQTEPSRRWWEISLQPFIAIQALGITWNS